MSKVREERIKLFAAFFNISAAGSFLAAVVTEPFAWTNGYRGDAFTLTGFMLISFGGAIFLHGVAQWILGRLEP